MNGSCLGRFACALGAVLALFAGCTAQPRSPGSVADRSTVESARHRHSPEPSRPRVAESLAPAPGDCPRPHPRPFRVVRFYGPLIGRAPLWAGVYARFHRREHAYSERRARRTSYGYRVKVLWVMAPDQQDPVSIRGHNLASKERLWFRVDDVGRLQQPLLDPAHPGTVPEHGDWREFPSYVYFHGSGCYEIEARWSQGKWRVVFGFGR